MAAQTPSVQKPGTGLPSPTLTNPDMILPSRRGQHYRNTSLSSLPDRDVPPSPPQLRLKTMPKSSQAREHRRQRLSREILRDSDAEIGSGNAHKRLSAKASAPALKTQDSFEMAKKRLSVERKWSDGSVELMNSEAIGLTLKSSTEGSDSVSAEDFEDEEYDERGIAELIGRNSQVAEEDGSEEEQGGIEDDPYSSMSRRAELILANAKKRLNLMEGNLRGARTSLKSPTPYSFNRSSPEFTGSPTFANSFIARESRIHSSLGFQPAQSHVGARRNSLVLPNGSLNHSRNLSESHAPVRTSSLSNRTSGRELQSSTNGRNGTVPSFLQSRSLRETRSSDVLGDSRSLHHPLRKPSLDWSSPGSLDPLPEDESADRRNAAENQEELALQRSSSTTNDLRNQMHVLKGRISTLRERTIEDNLRRRSMQSARIPSPFTDAEAWYTGAETYKGQSLNTDAGVGYSPTEQVSEDGIQSSVDKSAALDPSLEEGSTPDPRYSNPYSSLPIDPRLGGETQQIKSNFTVEEKELNSDIMTPRDEVRASAPSLTGNSTYEDAEEKIDAARDHSTPTAQDTRFKTSYFDDYDEDAEEPRTATRGTFDLRQDKPNPDGTDQTLSERHEDRADAFDYEHFYLHSSMGSTTRSRSPSQSSNESVETTKGPEPEPQSEPYSSTGPETPEALRDYESRMQHKRRESASSVSTMATFATATEGIPTPADEKEDFLPTITKKLRISSEFPANNGGLSLPATNLQGRPDSGLGIQKRDATGQQPSPITSPPQGETDPAMAASTRNRSTSSSNSSFNSPKVRSTSSPKAWVSPVVTPIVKSLLTSTRPAIKLEKRDETSLNILVESLREVCLRLSEGEDEEEVREWRRRLEEARRVLDGRSRPQNQPLN